MKYAICLQVLGIFSTNINFAFSYSDSTTYLTENFFANLQENLKDATPEPTTYQFIDRQVDNYIKLIQGTRDSENLGSRMKRNTLKSVDISRDIHDLYILEKLTPLDIIQTKFPQDIMLFKHELPDCEKWYAVVLENSNLKIYKYNDTHFVNLFTKPIKTGIKLGLHTFANGTFIVAAENSLIEENFHRKSTVYLFTRSEQLEEIQKFDAEFASDVSIWEDKGRIYMGISKEMSNTTGREEYETESVIYKWLGEHFDIIQHINTSEAMKIIPFVIGKWHFVAVANRQNNFGVSNVYSEILKYDLDSEKFMSYQKILTDGASDIKVFCFKKNNQHEYFLAVANSFSKDIHQNIIQKTNSIIYKFVDDNFIPFQSFNLIGLTEWLPVTGPNGEFALFAACKHEGLKIFQYNGWRFVETETQYTDDSFGKGILSMNSYQFQGTPVVVVANANDNGAMVNFYRVDFKKENQLNEYYDGMLTWCKISLMDAKKPKAKELVKVIKNTPTIEEKELLLSKRVTFKNVTVANLRTSEIENTSRKLRFSNDPKLEDLKAQLSAEKQNLEQLEAELQKLTNPKEPVIQNNIIAETVILTNDNFFNSIIAKTINGVDINDYLKNIVYLNINGFVIPRLELESAKFESNVTVRKINGRDVNTLLHTNEAMVLKNFVVEGNAIFDHLNIKGMINGANVTRETVLLVDEDQTLQGDLDVGKVVAENVGAKFLNKLNLGNSLQVHKTTQKIHSLDNLKIKELIVGGYLNDIDLPTLNKYALRSKGDQEVTGTYHFDRLKADAFKTQTMNGVRVPEQLVRIDGGDYAIDQDVQFAGELEGNGIFVSKRLNQIKVKRGKLDVLLKDSDERQEISGYKDFEHIDVNNPIDMQGSCCNNSKINPVRSIDEEITRIGDIVINGNVNIEDVLSVSDITTKDGEYSIGKLKEHGLRLNEETVPVHLNFTQQMNVLEVSVDTINGIDPSEWVLNGVADTQYIKGGKTFEGDLFITGDTNLILVNDINLPDMEENILNVNGDQTIAGKLHVQRMSTEGIQGTNIKLSTRDWTDIATNSNEATFTGEITMKSLSAKSINCTHLNISGTINAIDFNLMLEDTVYTDSKNVISSGHKHFNNLTVDNLTSRKNVDLVKIPAMIKKGEVSYNYNGVFSIPDDLDIGTVYFKNRLNHLNATEFSANWLGGEKVQIINDDQYFDQLVLLGGNTVLTNRINGVNLTELHLNTVKIDEPHEFHNVSFEHDFISLETIGLNGHIEGIDIDTILADTGDSELILTDTINFLNDVYVKGKVHTPSLVNGLNFTALCDFAVPDYNERPKKLIVKGDACFLKGPVVKNVNGLPIEELLKNTWLSNMETTIHGNLNFNKITFEDDVEVKGLLGDVKIDWLKNAYFSKTKNQTVSAKLDFSEGAVFMKNLIAPEGEAETISGIRLEDFVRTAVLDNFDQVFEQSLYAETIKFNDLQGTFSVNGYNLQSDVMRYDVPNMVTGKKTIQSAKTDRLKMDRNYKVQNVDLLDWVQKGVLRNNTRKIDGRVSFRGSTTFGNGISLSGVLNRNEFGPINILLKSTPQTITEKKVFIKSSEMQSLFKNVKLKGYLNYVEISDLIHNQASKNKENIFTSQVNFNTDLSAQNVIFKGLFQGINVSQLLYNLTNYVTLNNYYSNYDSLYQVSKKVRDSLSVQAHFLKYYKPLQYFTSVDALFPVKLNFYGDTHLATVNVVNSTHVINFFRWSPETNQFSINTEMLNINHEYYITRIAPIEFDEETYLYVEHKLTEPINGNWRIGEIITIINTTTIEILYEIPNNGTNVILPFTLSPEKPCVLMSYHLEPYINIYCEEDDDLQLYQKLDIEKALTTITTTIEDAVYIMAINEGRNKEDASVMIWKSDINTALFNIHQHIYIANANSIATIEYNGVHYLAISSGQLVNTVHTGQVTIKRFHHATQSFLEYQEIPADAPIQIEFSVLPSNELMMYVLSECSSKPLVIYKYEGLSKFTINSVATSLEVCNLLTHFNNYNKNFLVARSSDRFTVIEAVFKGY